MHLSQRRRIFTLFVMLNFMPPMPIIVSQVKVSGRLKALPVCSAMYKVNLYIDYINQLPSLLAYTSWGQSMVGTHIFTISSALSSSWRSQVLIWCYFLLSWRILFIFCLLKRLHFAFNPEYFCCNEFQIGDFLPSVFYECHSCHLACIVSDAKSCHFIIAPP